jgi:hypothetical protein
MTDLPQEERPIFLIATQLGKLIAEAALYDDVGARDLCFAVKEHMQEACITAIVRKEMGTPDG